MNNALMPFPLPTEAMQLALVDLALLGRGGEGAANILATGEVLPRIWDLTTVSDPVLLRETGAWLQSCVVWLNSQHAWFSSDLTPQCWEQHPSLVHQLGSLAASRYLAGESTDPAAMEEWHRYALPSYLERTREQRRGCEAKHQPWPARAACSRASTVH
ncbi:hypothetical protein [Tessaracoccus sp. MC1756]|uniref:hypothetical protein n=1 Tax=Tessaracoccus sp. MC1756 TaxID=2760311 RepID=UPI0015FF2AC7|nr:hypothetical protein [Tessaracoccus sp. MC1756]MBB1510639.1 hypothetical protein [Tessaracoccus sp. MC1756]